MRLFPSPHLWSQQKGAQGKKEWALLCLNTQHLGLSKGSGLQGVQGAAPSPWGSPPPTALQVLCAPHQCLMGSASSLSHRHLI